jgi:hypothetical protein
MAKAKQASPYLPMPKSVAMRSGCKVGWRYYLDEETAREAGKAARHNGQVDAARGYDFGYCAPGSVERAHGSWIEKLNFESEEIKQQALEQGLWEVCTS